VRGVVVKGWDECGGCAGFYRLLTKACGDGLPSASVVAFHEGEEEL
jgi:hypothetical protein